MKTKPFTLTQDAIDDIQHNVLNPLTIIVASVQMLKDDLTKLTANDIERVKRLVKKQTDRIVNYVQHFEADILTQPTDGQD